MFVRFVQIRIDPRKVAELSAVYTERVIPALLGTPGCLYCGLAQDAARPREAVSLTFWASRSHAEAYEKSGLFRSLFEESRPYLEDTMEWTVRLSEDLRLEAEVPEPEVEAYSEVSQPESTMVGPSVLDFRHIRLGTFSVREGEQKKFGALFHSNVLPLLREIEGCRYVQLVRSVKEPLRFVSITIWVSVEAAAECDRLNVFERVIEILRPTLSELSQWKLDLRPEEAARMATSEDLGVRSYVLLTGRAGGFS